MSDLSLFDLTGRVAIVTGGAGLLGRAFCRTLAEAGARVGVADLDVEAGQHLAGRLCEAGYTASSFPTDVTRPESVADLVADVLDAYGRVDVLVNSAALDPKFDPEGREEHTHSLEDYPLEAWNRALAVDLTGAFLCARAVAGPMRAQGKGSIINVSSIYGLAGPDQRLYQTPGQPPRYKPAAYSVTKAGLLGLTRYLATYFAGTEIRANALSPGGVFDGHRADFVEAYAARTVLGRMARPDDLTGALLFLASDASAYMTGANLVVDGGWTTW